MSIANNSTQVLKAARWMLDNVGWIKQKGELRDENGTIIGFCMEGALMAVEVGIKCNARHRAFARLQKVMSEAGYTSIVHFNDHKDTTKDKVLRAFDRAIKKGHK